MKDISIIIVNFNTSEYLFRCLESIYKSKLIRINLEIIIVDNNSTDNSVELIKKKYKGIHLICNTSNTGFSAANNTAIGQSHGKYILLLNPDTIVASDTLSKMLQFMEKNPSCSIASCRVELASGKIDDACHRGFPTPWRALCHFSGISSLFPNSIFFNGYHLGYRNMDKVHEIESCVGAFMLIRESVGDNVGWFDTDYFWYGEDIDFCYRVKEKGGSVVYVPFTKIIHFKGISSGIQRHSKHLSSASIDIKRKATKARFDVMRIFYQKHYFNKYPKWLTSLVLKGINIKERLQTI